ncbi:MAG: IclR family transcriptional regulator [Eubacteriales bacterium]
MKGKEGVTVQSVTRALDIIQCFKNNEELGISEIAAVMQLSKSTIYGLVHTLAVNGYLEQNKSTQKYRLGIKLFELGNIVHSRMDLRNEAKVYCQQLADKWKDTVHLATYYDEEIIYIDKINMPEAVIVYSQVGKRAPMHCTGVGKAILAYVDDGFLEKYISDKPLKKITKNTITNKGKLIKELEVIKTQGYAVDDEEIEIGLRCVAAPIFNYKGYPIAAISLSAPYRKLTDDVIKKISKDVMYYAQKISERVGYHN